MVPTMMTVSPTFPIRVDGRMEVISTPLAARTRGRKVAEVNIATNNIITKVDASVTLFKTLLSIYALQLPYSLNTSTTKGAF
jgi:hypothetical protein